MADVGGYFAGVHIQGIDEGIDDPTTIQSMQATPLDNSLELPVGPAGQLGPQGPAAAPYRHEGDITDQAALTALSATLGPAQAGKAWRVKSTNSVAYWNGTSFDYFIDAIGGHGPTGAVNTLSIGTVSTGAAGSNLSVSVTGTPPAQTVNLVVPRGIEGRKGPDGPPGPLRQASDYDNTVTHIDNMVPLWDAVDSKWTPTPYPGWRGPWTIVEDQRWDGGAGFAADITNSSTIPTQIASLPIPAQDCAWRPFVTGGAMVRCTGNRPAERMVVLALISGPNTIVAFSAGIGAGHNMYQHCTLVPQLRTQDVVPSGSNAVIAAGAAATIIVRIDGTASAPPFDYTRAYSHLAVWAVPVTGAPA